MSLATTLLEQLDTTAPIDEGKASTFYVKGMEALMKLSDNAPGDSKQVEDAMDIFQKSWDGVTESNEKVLVELKTLLKMTDDKDLTNNIN